MNDESGEEDQEEEEYDSEDDETYDGTEKDEERSDDQFVNESSDEGVGGIENDYDSDGNLIDDESDDDDDYDDEDDEDDAIGNVGNPNGGFHPLLHAHPMFQQALLQSLVQEEENTGDVPQPHAWRKSYRICNITFSNIISIKFIIITALKKASLRISTT